MRASTVVWSLAAAVVAAAVAVPLIWHPAPAPEPDPAPTLTLAPAVTPTTPAAASATPTGPTASASAEARDTRVASDWLEAYNTWGAGDPAPTDFLDRAEPYMSAGFVDAERERLAGADTSAWQSLVDAGQVHATVVTGATLARTAGERSLVVLTFQAGDVEPGQDPGESADATRRAAVVVEDGKVAAWAPADADGRINADLW